MKRKEIPIILKGKQIYRMEEYPPMISRVYEHFQNTYRIRKIYHVRGKAAYIEADRMPYSI